MEMEDFREFTDYMELLAPRISLKQLMIVWDNRGRWDNHKTTESDSLY